MKKEFRKLSILALLSFLVVLSACNKQEIINDAPEEEDSGKFTDLKVPEGFSWSTSKPTVFDLNFQDADGLPVSTEFSIYTSYPGGSKLIDGISKDDGTYALRYKIASRNESIVVVLPDGQKESIQLKEIQLEDYNNTDGFLAQKEITCKQPAFKSGRAVSYQYFPAEGQFGTLCFEDTWPHQADYDFNDVLIDYNVKGTYVDNWTVSRIDMVLYLRASGASSHNGLGISFKHFWCWDGFPQVDIGSVKVNGETIPAESGTSYPSYILIPDIEEHQPYYNTFADQDFRDPIRFEVSIEFATPAEDWWEVELPLNNIFLIIDGERGRELHLPTYVPTGLADPSYVGTGKDASDPYAFNPDNFKDSKMMMGFFTYKTEEEFPWVLDIYFDEAGDNLFRYPVEFMDIREAYYPAFENWVMYWWPWEWYLPEHRVEGKVYETIPDPTYPEMN